MAGTSRSISARRLAGIRRSPPSAIWGFVDGMTRNLLLSIASVLILATPVAPTALAKEDEDSRAPERPTPAESQEPNLTPVPPPRGLTYSDAPSVTVDLLVVSLPDKLVQPLLPDLRDLGKIEGAQRKLLELAASGEAKIEDWPDVTTLTGTRSRAENIREERYPIEFGGPPFTSKGDAAIVDAAKKEGWKIDKVYGVTFETRNIGTTLEIEPAVSSDGQSVLLGLEAWLVKFLKFAEFYNSTNAKGEAVMTPQPIFATMRATTTITLRNGQRMLVGFNKPADWDDRVLLFIVGAKITPPPKAR